MNKRIKLRTNSFSCCEFKIGWIGFCETLREKFASFEEYLAKKPGRVRQNVKTTLEIKATIEKALQSKATQADKDAAIRSML